MIFEPEPSIRASNVAALSLVLVFTLSFIWGIGNVLVDAITRGEICSFARIDDPAGVAIERLVRDQTHHRSSNFYDGNIEAVGVHATIGGSGSRRISWSPDGTLDPCSSNAREKFIAIISDRTNKRTVYVPCVGMVYVVPDNPDELDWYIGPDHGAPVGAHP